jgi:GcrA cell cycle regulator
VEVEQTSWPPAHSQALREYHARGMSYSQIARALNAQFSTTYTRNSALGRAKRMGLVDNDQKGAAQKLLERMLRERASRARTEAAMPEARPAAATSSRLRSQEAAAFVKAEPVELRCVDVSPRHLSLVELERNDCRYPYGGDEDGEAITFCGHRRRKGSSYCTPHFHLTRDPVVPTERAVSMAPLRLVGTDKTFDRLMETDAHVTDETQAAAQSREGARPAIA